MQNTNDVQGLEQLVSEGDWGGDVAGTLDSIKLNGKIQLNQIKHYVDLIGIVRNALKANPQSVVPYLKRAYEASLQVASKLKGNWRADSKWLTLMQAYCHSTAGEFAQHLAHGAPTPTEENNWTFAWFSESMLASHLYYELQPDNSFHSLNTAAEALLGLANLKHDDSFTLQAFQIYSGVPSEFAANHPLDASYSYSKAGNIAKSKYQIATSSKNQRAKWFDVAFDMYSLSAQFSGASDPRHSAKAYCDAADAAFYKCSELRVDKPRAAIGALFYDKFFAYYRENPKAFERMPTDEIRKRQRKLREWARAA